MKKTLAVLVSTVVGLLLCEAATRLLADRVLSLSHPAVRFDPALGWVQRAGETGVRKNEAGASVAIVGSPLGIRQPPRPYETVGRDTVLALGDSFTAGTQVAFEETWTARLEAMLRRGHGALQVVNAGVDRYDLTQQYRLAERLGRLFRPAGIVVALYVGNDLADYDRAAGARQPWEPGGPAVWIREHSYLYHFVAGALGPPRRVAQEEPSPVEGWSPRSVAGFPQMRPDQQARIRGQFAAGDVLPVWRGGAEAERRLVAAERVLDGFVALAGAGRLTLVVLPMKQEVIPEQRAELLALHRLTEEDLARPRLRLRDWASRRGVAFVDAGTALGAHPRPTELYWAVDSHMTPAGHVVVAEAVAPATPGSGSASPKSSR
jgi:hypothetical protein